jgi:hexosaminidase
MLLLTLLTASIMPALALWPEPVHHVNGSSIVLLARNFKIKMDSRHPIPADVKAAVDSAYKQLLHDGMSPLLVGLAALEREVNAGKAVLHTLQMSLHDKTYHLKSISDEVNKNIDQRDESYSLEIPARSDVAVLKANNSLGLLRGLQTFVQLVYTTERKERYILDAPHQISDKPAYAVRGLLLDTSRNFYPVKDLRRVLQAMSWSKMNFFHWHITDSVSMALLLQASFADSVTCSKLGRCSLTAILKSARAEPTPRMKCTASGMSRPL